MPMCKCGFIPVEKENDPDSVYREVSNTNLHSVNGCSGSNPTILITGESHTGSIELNNAMGAMVIPLTGDTVRPSTLEGVKHDQEKPVMALIPTEALEEEGWVWTFGGKKYGYWNWRKGIVFTRIISAMFRHMTAIMKGEDIDPESGKLHAAHIRCCAGMLITFQKTGRVDLDDRFKNETS